MPYSRTNLVRHAANGAREQTSLNIRCRTGSDAKAIGQCPPPCLSYVCQIHSKDTKIYVCSRCKRPRPGSSAKQPQIAAPDSALFDQEALAWPTQPFMGSPVRTTHPAVTQPVQKRTVWGSCGIQRTEVQTPPRRIFARRR